MPIDASIIGGIRPVQIPDATKAFGEGLQIQNALQQRQINAERLRAEQRQNKMADEDAADVEKQRTAYATAKGDPEGTIKEMIRLGVGPKGVQSTQQHFADYQKKISDIKVAELPTIKYRDEQMLGLHDQSIKMATEDPQGYASQYPALYQQAVKIDPEAAKHLDPNTPPTIDQLQMSRNGYATHTYFLSQEDEKRKQQKSREDAAKAARDAELQPSELAIKQGDAARQPLLTAEAQTKATASQRVEDAGRLAIAAKEGPDALAAAIASLARTPERLAPFQSINPRTAKPEDILAIGQTPNEQIVASNAGKNATEWQSYLDANNGDAAKALAAKQRDELARHVAGRDPAVSDDRSAGRLDKQVAQYGKPFEQMAQGAAGQLDKILDAEKMIAGGAVSQALAVPKILSALVASSSGPGGGSGVRITQAEINSILKARGIGGDIEAFLGKLKGDGNLSTEQKKQMNGILQDVRDRITEKIQIARSVSDEMSSAKTREEVIAAKKKGESALDAHAARGAKGKITIKAGDGSIHPFDTEDQAKKFEADVKSAGGTTTRQ